MKKITIFLASFVLFASVYGQSHLMSVDGQETHKNLNPNPYEIKTPTEYTGLVFQQQPIAGVTVYYALCDKTCYANHVQVSAQVGLVQVLHQLSLINRAEQGQLYTFNGQVKDFDISDTASVSVAKDLIEKYGTVKHVDFKGGTFSLLGVKNDFGGGNGWITYNAVGDWNCLLLDLSSVLSNPTSIYPLTKADCVNNGDDAMLMAIKNDLASLITAANNNPIPGGGNPNNDPKLQEIIANAKANSNGNQPIIINYNVAQGGQGGTATATAPVAASNCGCPNPNATPAPAPAQPAPLHHVGGPGDPAYVPQTPTYTQQTPRYVQQQQTPMYIQNAQGQQVMAPQGSYQQGNYLYNQNGQIIAQLNGIRQAGIATAVGTWLEVGLTGLFGGLMMRNNRGGSNVSSLHYVGGPGTGGAVNWPNGLTSGGNTSTLSGGPVNWNNGVYGH